MAKLKEGSSIITAQGKKLRLISREESKSKIDPLLETDTYSSNKIEEFKPEICGTNTLGKHTYKVQRGFKKDFVIFGEDFFSGFLLSFLSISIELSSKDANMSGDVYIKLPEYYFSTDWAFSVYGKTSVLGSVGNKQSRQLQAYLDREAGRMIFLCSTDFRTGSLNKVKASDISNTFKIYLSGFCI